MLTEHIHLSPKRFGVSNTLCPNLEVWLHLNAIKPTSYPCLRHNSHAMLSHTHTSSINEGRSHLMNWASKLTLRLFDLFVRMSESYRRLRRKRQCYQSNARGFPIRLIRELSHLSFVGSCSNITLINACSSAANVTQAHVITITITIIGGSYLSPHLS